MSVLVDENSRVVVQGITGGEGRFHTEQMLEYGTDVVAGVVPGKGGQAVAGVPVYDTVSAAVRAENADTSVVFVPPGFAADALFEALDADLDVVVAITEGVPTQDVSRVSRVLDETDTHLVGPNGPGVITPGETKAGILPGNVFEPGPVGLVSRSGTLTYQIVDSLTARGFGQSTAVGIGGDPIVGTGFVEGRTAPPGRRMGHAGAIVSGSGTGTAQNKIDALESAGVSVGKTPAEVVGHVADLLG